MIRTPEFHSSPSRRLRTELSIESQPPESTIADAMEVQQNDAEEQNRIRLLKKSQAARSSRKNETDEQRHSRLAKQRERTETSRRAETEEQRLMRLEKLKETSQSNRRMETDEQRLLRLAKLKERSQSNRRMETEEQRLTRLEQQRKRSDADRAKNRIGKQVSMGMCTEQRSIEVQYSTIDEYTSSVHDLVDAFAKKSNVTNQGGHVSSSCWPSSIPCELKESCLNRFLQRTSMTAIAETVCAVCNVRAPKNKSKMVAVSKISRIDLLRVTDDLKGLITGNCLSSTQR